MLLRVSLFAANRPPRRAHVAISGLAICDNQKMKSRVRDISQPLRTGIPVWYVDTGYCDARTLQPTSDCPVDVAKFSLSTHSGAHADAPLHCDAAGLPIGAVSLDASSVRAILRELS